MRAFGLCDVEDDDIRLRKVGFELATMVLLGSRETLRKTCAVCKKSSSTHPDKAGEVLALLWIIIRWEVHFHFVARTADEDSSGLLLILL